jgi:pyridoxal phosphate enzyme (YggS family)
MEKEENYGHIQENYREIKKIVSDTATKVGVDPETIKIIAVTKTHPVELINQATFAGIEYIGENRVQEAEEKIPLLNQPSPEFHFIGHLQRNKINKLLSLNPALIHSIDSISLAKSLNNSAKRIGRIQPILFQINTSGEESKSGFAPDYSELLEAVRQISQFSNVNIKGWMSISKLTDDATEIRECFVMLREIYERLQAEKIENCDMEILSMGMSGDYQIAIEEGANMLRIGSAIFGHREN